MMQHYMSLKEKYQDCLVFYRLGDFYEMFFDDAKIASKELQLALTGRDCGLSERAPMCGVPHHSVNSYINKLLEKNYKVAICEQLTDPKEAVGLVDRDVIRVITPGTVIEDDLLNDKHNNFLAAVYLEKSRCGIAWADVSTGEFNLTQLDTDLSMENVADKLLEIQPNEILASSYFRESTQKWPEHLRKQFKPFTVSDTMFDDEPVKAFRARFKDAENLDKKQAPAIRAASALWAYLGATQKNDLAHMNKLAFLESKDFLMLDAAAIRNLELFKSLGDHGERGTLLWLMDRTETAMGGRKVHTWIERPLRKKTDIERRLSGVEELVRNFDLREDLVPELAEISDIERICTRIAYGTVNAREAVFMRKSLERLPKIKALLADAQSEELIACRENIDALEDLCKLLTDAIDEDPAETITEGGIIKKGYNEKLDSYRDAIENGQSWVLKLEAKEREETGIKTLKIKYNKVFGYTIEVSNSFLDKVPYTYQRRQTLTNGERFTTQELKDMEDLITGSQEKAVRLEYTLFLAVRDQLMKALFPLKKTAEAIGELDALVALAKVAEEYRYVRPAINEVGRIQITGGRHPVIEAMQRSGAFVPNDTFLDQENDRFMVITGPNMAGKSTYMRQVALITLLAHVGSFVPAQEADIALCDRIFTRVGASDDLSAGQSTFMVEMNEVANIIKNATKDSLIILDEIGRGTSTFDGLSIAWAVTEYIANTENIGAKTLFATHYHELSELEGTLPGVKNYCITAREYGDDVIFLRKIVRGSADKSFGIAVAHLAGIPKPVLKRAREILASLEKADISHHLDQPVGKQTMMFASSNMQDIVDELKAIDVNTLTPLEALNKLCELREKAKRE